MIEKNGVKAEENLMEQWLAGEYDYEQPVVGEIRKGILLEVSEAGALVDIGLKHDGIVPRQDIERLEEETLSGLEPGQEVTVRVLRADDREGNLLLSLYQALSQEDWTKARELLDSNDIWYGRVTGYNRGGLLVDFYRLQAFVPASHVSSWQKGKSGNGNQNWLKEFIGQQLPLKVIEADADKHRLIMSERLASEDLHEEKLADLMAKLAEGEVRRGVVRHLTDFGAFVSLGAADGLIHISELAWHHVAHPSEVLDVGDEIDVYVLNLDEKRQRINLSLKRLQPDPWTTVDAFYKPDQLVLGTVTNVRDFGAFVVLKTGIEGLVHVSEMADPTPNDAREFVELGNKLVLRVLQIEPSRRRMGLSLKSVSDEERQQWWAEQGPADATDDLETAGENSTQERPANNQTTVTT
jgi:small subunit ribosomal protein S1